MAEPIANAAIDIPSEASTPSDSTNATLAMSNPCSSAVNDMNGAIAE